MNASAPGFLGSGSNNAVTPSPVSPSAFVEMAGVDHVCSLELASRVTVDLSSMVVGSFLDPIDFGHGNMLGT
ncbi:hypothetical protein NDU88_004942 [Pleurodeles waltl]|uniref:Uncharacterized protein n=1 Tax=Pleurodeles waltl TaxID=8319 RepID=A0AAV7MZ03_PLEWA|nr:hypothetical protein NDU88_004942 [Pleurodeles waltl]